MRFNTVLNWMLEDGHNICKDDDDYLYRMVNDILEVKNPERNWEDCEMHVTQLMLEDFSKVEGCVIDSVEELFNAQFAIFFDKHVYKDEDGDWFLESNDEDITNVHSTQSVLNVNNWRLK